MGLPRTGTTLIDRIIGNHSEVHSAGELTAMTEAVDPRSSALRSNAAFIGLAGEDGLTAAFRGLDGRQIAEEYLARSHARRGERPRFTDKLPTNFFYCALILRAFPNAHIVHLTRHPLATCLAVYRHPIRWNLPVRLRLGEIGEFYIAYHRLMAHWHRVLPERILDVAYEDVVTESSRRSGVCSKALTCRSRLRVWSSI